MADRSNPFSRIRLVYRRSSTLLKCVVLTAIVLSTVAILTLRSSIGQEQAKADELRAQAAGLEQANSQLQQDIDQLGTIQSIKDIAGEKLNLVDPDTVFFTPVN